MKTTMTQKEAQKYFLPIIRAKGNTYYKFQQVAARKAVPGEKIETFTSDGKETENTAGENDMVVKNIKTGAQEEYILNTKKFQARYVLVEKKSDGWDVYKPTGKVNAIEFNKDNCPIYDKDEDLFITATWNETMPIKLGDFVCTPDGEEIYRIARKEFFETYKKKKDEDEKDS
jgi:hypothetical protein